MAPLIQCDYCPLLFHMDCLEPPLTAMPLGRWMCPNHIEHVVVSTAVSLQPHRDSGGMEWFHRKQSKVGFVSEFTLISQMRVSADHHTQFQLFSHASAVHFAFSHSALFQLHRQKADLTLYLALGYLWIISSTMNYAVDIIALKGGILDPTLRK